MPNGETVRKYSETSETVAWIVGFSICFFIAANLYPGKVPNIEKTGILEVAMNSLLQPDSDVIVRRPIIFVESSMRTSLTFRQACAVESAARWNPNMSVLVFVTSAPEPDQPLLGMLSNKHGARFVPTDLAQVFKETPLESWYQGGYWKHRDFQTVHLSDALRLSLLWRLGGIYLDLDIVVQRPLDSLSNAIVTEKEDYLCNAVMAFPPRHGFIEQSLLDFAANYSNATWIANGPVLVTRVAHRYCGVNHTDHVNDAPCDLNVLPPSVGYALEWEHWPWFFQKERTEYILSLFKEIP